MRDKILQRLGLILEEPIQLKVTAAEPIIIKENISFEMALKIQENRKELPGVVVSHRPVRRYPSGQLAAHLLGYIGEIESAELYRLTGRQYKLGDIVGKSGVEKIYDQQLRGIDGGKKIEVDV